MYEMNPVWEPYYRELEPARRLELLTRFLKEEADDGANIWRQRLFSLRCMEEGRAEPTMDRYLWQCVNLAQIYNTSRVFRKASRKEIGRFFEECGFNEALAAGPDGEKALYFEIRNAAKRYFATCQGSEYRRALFGLLSPGVRDQKEQMGKDVWKMTCGIRERFELDGAIEIWTKAVQDEYAETDPEAAEKMRAMSAEEKH